jgi:hypothetical protein
MMKLESVTQCHKAGVSRSHIFLPLGGSARR